MHWYSYYSTAICEDTVAQKEEVTFSIAARMLVRFGRAGMSASILVQEMPIYARDGSESTAWSRAYDCLSTTLEPLQLRLHFATYLTFCILQPSHDPAPRLSPELSDPKKLLPLARPHPRPRPSF